MPPERKSKPRSPDHAALGQATEMLVSATEGMTQERVAEDGGLKANQVGAIIRGQGNPSYTTLLRLAKGLHIRPGTLLVLADELRDKQPGR